MKWLHFLRKQQDRLDAHRARSNENIYRVEAILKRVAITQERAEKLLATLKGGQGGVG
jgi:hypothetical protein